MEAGDKEESAGAQLRHVGRAGGESNWHDSTCTCLYLDVSLLWEKHCCKFVC